MAGEVEIVNAIIESARIGFDRDIFLCAWVMCDYGGSGQGFGGRVLGGTKDCAAGNHGAQPNYAAEEIVSILRAADVEQWNQLPGKAIRVKRSDGLIVGIGHITREDRWYEPAKAFAAFPKPTK